MAYINFSNIPEHEVERGCAEMSSIISRKLTDPKLKREYEEFKVKYHQEGGKRS